MIQAVRMAVADGRLRAIRLGSTKMPDPITMPTTMAVASSTPSLRARSCLLATSAFTANPHESIIGRMLRRNFCSSMLAGGAMARLARSQQPQQPAAAGRAVLERSLPGQPHKGKVLLALQA